MCFYSGVVIPVTDAIGLAGMQGANSMRGLATRGTGAQDLVKSRTRAKAVKLREDQAPHLFGLRLGRHEIPRDQRLDLVDCVGLE